MADKVRSSNRRRFIQSVGLGSVVALAGCGSNSTTEQQTDGGGVTDTKSNAVTTLQVRHFVNDHLEAFYEKHNPILKKEHGIEVDFETMGWDVARRKQNNSISTRTGPDVEEIASTWLPKQVKSDGWMDLGQAGVELPTDDIYDAPTEIGNFDGVTAGFPWFWGPRGHVYHQPLLEEAGISGSPESWDELLSHAKKYNKQAQAWEKEGHNTRYLFGIPGANNFAVVQYYMMFVWQNGGQMLKDGKAVFDSDRAVEAMNFYKDLATEHNVSPKSMVEWNGVARNNAFKSKRIASTWQGLRVANSIETELGVGRPPAGPNGESSTFFGVNLMGIHPWTDKTDAAATYLKYLMKPKVNAELAKGSGFLPTIKSSFEKEEFQGDLYQTFNNEVLNNTNAKTAPQVVGWGDVSGAIKSATTDILTKAATGTWSKGDTETALKQAATQANSALGN
ncbi:extracellular solute-binding protein [Halorhabdus rudnickae]|uniref:extracellular solute-binding protein n=1 Tax=Halorhabdus rudnickae TaxID=1775544 RepID=UPI0010844D5A|nr:extracellular solute-binding protein [Halorhabdus rudnickae]